jgi:mono/diheme cytochrome c family protein
MFPVAAGLLWAPSAPEARAQTPDVWEAPAEAKELQNPVRTDGGTVARGQKLFQRYCVPCHGMEGAADGKMAQRLGYKPANLTLEQMSRLPDGEIFWKISKGRKPMPTFEQQLSRRERWDLVSYVRTLVRQAP